MNDILFGNNNKAVIKKLANRSFRSNKMRNVIAAIAIALTTFLFTAVLTIGMGASGTLEYSMAKMMGSSADALVQGLSEDQLQQLKENAMFEKVGCWIPVEIMTNTNRRVAEVDYADQTQLEIRMLTPRTGSAPQKANEVLVSANILKDLNIEEKIGAEIPVELKVRQSGQVYHFDMVVSGIYDTPNEKSESVIVSKAFLEENAEMMSDIALGRVGCGIYTADVVMRDSYMVKDRMACPIAGQVMVTVLIRQRFAHCQQCYDLLQQLNFQATLYSSFVVFFETGRVLDGIFGFFHLFRSANNSSRSL